MDEHMTETTLTEAEAALDAALAEAGTASVAGEGTLPSSVALRRQLPPEGEAFEGAAERAFPLRGRWLPEGQTDEVGDTAAPPDERTPDTAPENAADDDLTADDPADDGFDAAFAAVLAESEGVAALYPDFTLGTALADPAFGRTLAALQRAGVPEPVRTAYECVHRDELLGRAMAYAAHRARTALAEGIRSGALRPAENGVGAAAESRVDPRTLSADQRRSIRQRVMKGEKIRF